MPRRCVVAGCDGEAVTKVRSIHLFPTATPSTPGSASVRQQWVKFVQVWRVGWQPTATSMICSDHFTPDDFTNWHQFTAGLIRNSDWGVMAASGSCPLNKSSFYGLKDEETSLELRVRLARRERELRKYPGPVAYTPRLGGPSSQWRIFPTQQQAFDFRKSSSQDLAVFSSESESFCERQGQRLFLVTSYEQFWHYYKQLDVSRRHHYEVIPEAAVCNLYFDLEFSKEHNLEKRGEVLTEIFINYVNQQLKQEYGITCRKSDILQLEASTNTKFSRHLIYRLQKAAFKDNMNAGSFVKKICSELDRNTKKTCVSAERVESVTIRMKPRLEENSKDIATDRDNSRQPESQHEVVDGNMGNLDQLYIKDRSGKDILFCDTGVYTRNRNFRLIHSCKLGRKNPLVLSEDNEYVATPSCTGISEEEQMFLDSLVTNVQFVPGLRILTSDFSKNTNQQVSSEHKAQCDNTNPDRGLVGSRHSPYPEIDEFISSQLSIGGVQGTIRQWCYFSSNQTLLYEISKNRYCHNIKRQHKSNNVFYIVDLLRSVYYQKCHDPQCRGDNFKSPDLPLPSYCQPGACLTEENDFDESVSGMSEWDEVSDRDLVTAAVASEQDQTGLWPGDDDVHVSDSDLLRAVCDHKDLSIYE